MKITNRGAKAAFAATGVIAMLAIAGCSGSAQPGASVSPGQLPQKYVEAGKITASTICDGKPFSYCEAGSTKAEGVFADVAAAWGKELGVTVDPIGMAFDSIIPSTVSGRFDIVLAIGDTKERQKQFDFIDILKSSYAIVVPAGNPKGASQPSDLCGLTVSSTTGSAEAAEVDKLSKKCVSDGKPAIKSLQLGDLGSCYLAVSSGRADAAWGSDASSYAIEAESPDKYKVAFEVASDTVFAIAIPKKNPELRDAIAAAVAKTMKDGSYIDALKKWHLQTQAVDKLMINLEPATVPGS